MKSALVIIDLANKSQMFPIRFEDNRSFSKKEMTQRLKETFGDVKVTFINSKNRGKNNAA